jgi:hypothetical protein
MILTVADRFAFGPREIMQLTVRELIYWYNGAVRLSEHDRDVGDNELER